MMGNRGCVMRTDILAHLSHSEGHDLGHIRQVAELMRARKYLVGAGPLGKEYRLKP
jgi:hypothetical protein